MDRRVAPDRGYAWVVLAASVGFQYLTGVLVHIVGIIHVELLDKFQDDVTTTAWAGSLYSSLQMLGAPLASALVYAHSCRLSVVMGWVLVCVGFVTSAFVTSVLQLVLTYGLIAGIGFGLTYTPSLMIITFYFDKFHGLASGLSVAGCAVGILTGSLMTRAFIDTYSLRGAFLISAGLGLQGCIFGMLFRPTHHEGKGRPCWRQGREQRILLKASGERAETPGLLKDSSKDPFNQELYVPDEYQDPAFNVEEDPRCEEDDREENVLHSVLGSSMRSGRRVTNLVASSWADRVKTGNENGMKSSALLNQNENPNIEISVDTKPSKDDESTRSSHPGCLNTFRGVCSLMKNWAFLVHCCGVFFAALNVSGVFLHLPEYARTHGTQSTQAATLFVGVGIFSLFSRIGIGLLMTSTRINGLVLSVGLMTLCGLSSCLFPLYSSTYVGQMTFASLFGLSTGGFFTLINVLTVQLVDFNLLPAAYGVVVFVIGLGYVTGPPMSGAAMFASAACDLMAKVIDKRQTRPHR